MGKKEREQQRRFDAMMATLQQQIAASQKPSAYETAWLDKFNKTENFLNSKDYRNLPAGVNIDLMGQADNNRMRRMMLGNDSGDQAAAGTMGRIGQSQKMLLNDQAAKDWSGAFEEKIGGLMNQQMGLSEMGQGAHSNRMAQGISGYSNMIGLLGQRPKESPGFWGSLFKGMVPGLAQAGMSLI
jgi:hypothetical protein